MTGMVGTYTIAQGTTYEAESATRAGNTTVISNSAFSEGQGIGYIGTSKPIFTVYLSTDG